MLKDVRISIFVAGLIAFSTDSFCFELIKGITPDADNWAALAKADYDAGYFPLAIVQTEQEGVIYVYDGGLGKTNYQETRLLDSWPLVRWQYQSVSPEQEQLHAQFVMDYPSDSYKLSRSTKGIGCFSEAPLRYGDFDADTKNEVVMFLDNDLVVFSPEYERIVFAVSLDSGDWLGREDTDDLYQNILNISGDYQYVSELAAANDEGAIYGVRDYAKLYFGDFDADGNRDIVVWRKVYHSRPIEDTVEGFSMARQDWYHYERDLIAQAENTAGVTGEYLPQNTDPAVIQQWLATNELTWSKGWPSTSECEGQEEQLIPEMHDPLLNDPDVLK